MDIAKNSARPVILEEGRDSLASLRDLRATARIWEEVDVYSLQVRELFEIENPTLRPGAAFEEQCSAFIAERVSGQEERLRGSWIYFPWNGTLLHGVSEKDYVRLRTNRNRNLVTEDEQRLLREACIGIVGLSVGSNVAAALAYCGIGRHMKLSDFDTLETTNLNRVRGALRDIGMKKTALLSRQLYDIDPYLTLSLYEEKMDKRSVEAFLLADPKPRVIFEIIDSFETKIHLRALARREGIPVIMVTNLGDRVLMDVERYDLGPNTEFFNGRAGQVPADILEHPDATDADKHKYAVLLAGVEHIPRRALESVAEIGRTLVGRPQLASTVALAGGMSAYLARKIILGEPLPSRSWLVDLDSIFREETAL